MKYWLATFFVIGLSIAAYALTGTSPPVDIPITITAPTGGSTPPTQATVANFSTPIVDSDFTTSAYANTSTWLDCAQASNPIWQQGDGFPIAAGTPCPTITTDNGVQVLQMVWPSSMNIPFGGGNGITANGTTYAFPATSFYVEGVLRWPVNLANSFLLAPWIALFNSCSLEFDVFENTSNSGGGGYYGDSVFHYCGQASKAIWSAPGQPAPPNYPGFDLTQYHTYGARVTTDASTGIYFCEWIDNRLQGCITITSSDPQPGGITQAMVTTTPGLVNFISGGPSNSGALPSDLTEYVKRLTIWSCPSWRSSNQVACKTSVLDPGGY